LPKLSTQLEADVTQERIKAGCRLDGDIICHPQSASLRPA
jgi:hypothetical protein